MNTNVLAGMKCPACGSEEPFRVEASASALVYDDGIEDVDHVEWEDDHVCVCVACKHRGVVADFKEEKPC